MADFTKTEARFWRRFGERVRKLRGDETQQAIADALGCARTGVVHIEKGRVRVSAYRLAKLAKALRVDVGELL